MYSVPSDIRNGLKVEMDNQPWTITYFQFVKPGKGTAFTRMKFKSLITGNVVDRTFRSGEKLQPADVNEQEMQYLYNDDESFHFMDTSDYAQVAIPNAAVGDTSKLMLEEMIVKVLFYKGNAINIELPNFVELEVTYCEPAVKGNTAQGATKTATLSTGAEIQVPLFVENGETLKIDTRDASYVERVRK